MIKQKIIKIKFIQKNKNKNSFRKIRKKIRRTYNSIVTFIISSQRNNQLNSNKFETI